MLELALLECMINEKCYSVERGTGHLPSFFVPPRGFDSSRVPTPGNLLSKAKKILMPGGQPASTRKDVASFG